MRGGGHYECNHCSTTFVNQAQPPAPPPAPSRQLKAPVVNSYGPQTYGAPTVTVVHHAAPASRFRWGWWLFMMLFAFGAPAIGAVVTFLQSAEATKTAKASSTAVTSTSPKTPTSSPQVQPRRPGASTSNPSPSSDDDAEAEAEAESKTSDDQARGEGTSLDEFMALKGCSCRAKSGPVDLHTRYDGGDTTITGSGTTRSMQLSFAVKTTGQTPFTLPLAADTAPASSYPMGRFPLGVGCEGDTLVIASGRSLTAWSLSDRKAVWTRALPSSFGDVQPADKPAIDCKSVSVRGGTASLRVGGKSVKARLSDGETPGATPSRSKSAPNPEVKPEPAPEPESDPKPDASPKPSPAPTPEDTPTKAGKKKKKKKKGKKKKKKG